MAWRRMRSVTDRRLLTLLTAVATAISSQPSAGTTSAVSAGPPLAQHHRLGDLGLGDQHPLDPRRRDVLAAGQHDHVLLAVGDPQVSVVVQLADVAGVQPAVADRPLAVSSGRPQ